jgi:hypothetical protein
VTAWSLYVVIAGSPDRVRHDSMVFVRCHCGLDPQSRESSMR